MRGAWALVPVKAFASAKSRLARVLPPPAREAFARALMAHVVEAAFQCPEIDGVLVATDSAEVAELARNAGAWVIADPPPLSPFEPPTLGAVVDAALTELAYGGTTAVVVLMADLPLLEPEDISEVLDRLATSDVVIAPDRRSAGTNALALAPQRRISAPPGLPPPALLTRFGHADSFRLHARDATADGRVMSIVRNPRLALDVDDELDLECARVIAPTWAGWEDAFPARAPDSGLVPKIPDDADDPKKDLRYG